MPESFVNQLMSCYWIEMGLEIESLESEAKNIETLDKKLREIRARKPSFNF